MCAGNVMPSLLELAGAAAAQPALWDGRSAAAHLLGTATLSARSWRTELLIEHFAHGEELNKLQDLEVERGALQKCVDIQESSKGDGCVP